MKALKEFLVPYKTLPKIKILLYNAFHSAIVKTKRLYRPDDNYFISQPFYVEDNFEVILKERCRLTIEYNEVSYLSPVKKFDIYLRLRNVEEDIIEYFYTSKEYHVARRFFNFMRLHNYSIVPGNYLLFRKRLLDKMIYFDIWDSLSYQILSSRSVIWRIIILTLENIITPHKLQIRDMYLKLKPSRNLHQVDMLNLAIFLQHENQFDVWAKYNKIMRKLYKDLNTRQLLSLFNILVSKIPQDQRMLSDILKRIACNIDQLEEENINTSLLIFNLSRSRIKVEDSFNYNALNRKGIISMPSKDYYFYLFDKYDNDYLYTHFIDVSLSLFKETNNKLFKEVVIYNVIAHLYKHHIQLGEDRCPIKLRVLKETLIKITKEIYKHTELPMNIQSFLNVLETIILERFYNDEKSLNHLNGVIKILKKNDKHFSNLLRLKKTSTTS